MKREAWREAGKLSADDPRRQELLAQAKKADEEAPLLQDSVDVGKLLKSLPVGTSPLVVTNARRSTPEGY